MKTQQTALMSWSGGKDSCLALWRARRAGMTVPLLITAMDESGTRARSHGVPPALLLAQAASLDAELRFYSASWAAYEEKFIAMLRAAAAEDFGHAIFGDIDLAPHRAWEEKVCAAAGLIPQLPLWDEPRRRLVDEFIAAGFKAVVVCVDGEHLPAEFCGRDFDAAFLADLPPGVDACGENGEFHTFVYDGPAFRAPVALRRTRILDYRSPGGATDHFQELAPASEAARAGARGRKKRRSRIALVHAPRRRLRRFFNHRHQLDVKHQARIRRNVCGGGRAVGQSGWNHQGALAAHGHAGDALIPAGNDGADTQGERKRATAAVNRRTVERRHGVAVRQARVIQPARVTD